MATSPYVVGASVVGPIAFLIVLGLSIWIKKTVASDTIPNIKLGLVIAIVVGYIIAHSIFVGYTFTISQLSGSQKTIEGGCEENPMEKETVRYNLSYFLNASGPSVFSFGFMFYFVLLAALAFLILNWGTEWKVAENGTYLIIIAICLVLLFIDGITAVSVGAIAKPLMTEYDGMFAGQLKDIFNQMRTNDKTDINKIPSNLAKIITHRVLSENPGLNTVDGVQRLLNSGETADHIPLKDYLSFHASSKDVSQLFAGNVVGEWKSHKNVDASQWDNIQRRMKADTTLTAEQKGNLGKYFDSLLGKPAQREKLLQYVTFNVNIPAMDIQRSFGNIPNVPNVYAQVNNIVNPLIFASWVGLAAIAYLVFHPLYVAGYGAGMIMAVFAVIMITMVFFWIAISFAA